MREINVRSQTTVLQTLIMLIHHHPTLHRSLYQSLRDLALCFVDNCTPGTTLLGLASRLYAALHYTAGLVGSASLWRKSVVEMIERTLSAFVGLRTTFHIGVY